MPHSATISQSRLNQRAQVPEHSTALMQAMSQGTAFIEGEYLFVAADDWLMAVGYPLAPSEAPHISCDSAAALDSMQACARRYAHNDFAQALAAAQARTHAVDCWAIGPDLPPHLQAQVTERDEFYILPSDTPPPAALRGPLVKAAGLLRVEEGRVFSPEHRRLWAEFMGRKALKANVRELFARTPQALEATAGDDSLYLLNAWDTEGHLAACLLLDYSAAQFSSYVIGAHSSTHYTAHAADLLFAVMLEHARQRGKAFVHLGLGVNEGIRRFKKKWGGIPALPYVMAAWREQPTSKQAFSQGVDTKVLLQILMPEGHEHLSKRQMMDALPAQRPFAMLWELEKNGKKSWLAGTAHFFCYSFEHSFRQLFEKVDTLIFEGPLDPQTLALVDQAGKQLQPASGAPVDHPPLIDLLTEAEIRTLERVVRGPEGFWPRLLNMEAARKVDVRWYLRHARPWCAMFTLWTGFLERNGWRQSVDLEAWYLGQEMGKAVLGMESLEEQLASLDAVPVDRVIRHFQHCRQWDTQVKRNVHAYLAGDLYAMMGSSTEFPTRTNTIIGKRDQRFRERMLPFIEAGRCVVFVGSAHLLNLRGMLAEDGFTVRQCLPTFMHRLKARWRTQPELQP